jgi:hypothetical protein
MSGAILVTPHPESVETAAIQAVDLAVALGESADGALRAFGRVAGVGGDEPPATSLRAGEALAWSRETGNEVVRVPPSRAERRRHRREHAEGELPPERSFHFRGPHRKLNLRAQNLVLFLQIGDGVDDETWLHHLHQGDYSRWVRTALNDDALADELAAVEQDESVGAPEGRARIRSAIEERYPLPANRESAA